MTPLDLIKPEQLYLPAYKWYSDLRPVSPEDIFRKPEVKIEVVEEKNIASIIKIWSNYE